MRHLITYEEISQLARPCTTDEDIAKAMIAEAQRVEIKPRLGDALYLKLLNLDERFIVDAGSAEADFDIYIAADEDAPSTISSFDPCQILLEGGQWIDSNGDAHLLTGLKTALAYYTLARITRDGNIQETRYGSVIKDDQYSTEPEKAERQRQYRELFSQADSYMAEALFYVTQNRKSFPEYKTCAKMRSNRMTIRTIGQ